MKRKSLMVLTIASFIVFPVGCKQYSYYDAPDNINPSATSNDFYFWASDSVRVYNANLDKIDRTHICNRIFSSNDIARIRKETTFLSEYIEIVEATAVNLGHKLWPDGNTFDIKQENNKHFFYMRIPCQFRKFIKKNDIALEIPITYFSDNVFFIHKEGLTQSERNEIKNSITDIDAASVEKWIARCEQGTKQVPRVRNKTIRYLMH